jgi:hypothetical protein
MCLCFALDSCIHLVGCIQMDRFDMVCVLTANCCFPKDYMAAAHREEGAAASELAMHPNQKPLFSFFA